MRIPIVIVLFLLWCTPGFASYLPLAQGAVWYYTSSPSPSVQRTVDGTQLVGLETTSVVKNLRPGGLEESWWNFWTVDEQGNVFLHGYRNLTAGIGVRYDPPILWIAPGETSWNTVTIVRDLDLEVDLAVQDVRITATEGVPVGVPAGSFSTIALDVNIIDVDPVKTLACDVLGRRLVDGAAKQSAIQQWYADGVGLVRESFCCPLATDELSSYQVVGAATVTWTNVKARFDR